MATKATKVTKTPKIKILEEEVAKGRQSAIYTRIYEENEHKFKIKIERDSYDFQSSARAYVWKKDSLEWSQVCSIHYSNMGTIKYNHLSMDAPGWFISDYKKLQEMVRKIVF